MSSSTVAGQTCCESTGELIWDREWESERRLFLIPRYQFRWAIALRPTMFYGLPSPEPGKSDTQKGAASNFMAFVRQGRISIRVNERLSAFLSLFRFGSVHGDDDGDNNNDGWT